MQFDFFGCWQRRQKEAIDRTAFELRADAANAEQAGILDIVPGTPIFLERSDVFTKSGGACHIRTVYRHDQSSFKRVFFYNQPEEQ